MIQMFKKLLIDLLGGFKRVEQSCASNAVIIPQGRELFSRYILAADSRNEGGWVANRTAEKW